MLNPAMRNGFPYARGDQNHIAAAFGQVYQGLYATLLMAKAGADVIKIEPPQGEPLAGANRPLAGIVVLASAGFLRSCHSSSLRTPRR
jgi:crotonobetainyl-CoA:carnitine CoA-transferase CaiB-like acyl-CoA transferase